MVGEGDGGKLGTPRQLMGMQMVGTHSSVTVWSPHVYFFIFLPEGRTKGYFATAMTEGKQMDGIYEKSLWQREFTH